MNHETQLPLYAKLSLILLGLCLSVGVLYVGRGVLIPIAYGAFLSIMVSPIERRLERRKVPKVLAILLCLALIVVVLAGITYFVTVQAALFTENIPAITEKLSASLATVQQFVEQHISVTPARQLEWLRTHLSGAMAGGISVLQRTMLAVVSFVELATLVPIYVFLFLYYRQLFRRVALLIFPEERRPTVTMVLDKTGSMINQYLIGKAIETAILVGLSTGGLLLLGIDHAFLFGIIAALLNLIPFVGVVIGSGLPAIMALLTKDSLWYAVGVIGLFTVIQFIDNHAIIPMFVGSQISINAAVVLVVLFVGGEIWGIAGLVLSLPIVAVLKIIFDHVESLHPWGLLLGNEIPAQDV